MRRLGLGPGFLAGVLIVAGGACSGNDAASRGTATTVPKAATAGPTPSSVGAQPGVGPSAASGSQAPATAGADGAAGAGTGVAAAELGKVVVVRSVPPAVVRGQATTATFRTRPGSTCQLDVRYANGPGTDNERMPPATANADGDVTWTWTVSGAAEPGDAAADVVCSGGAKGEARIAIS
jgi:hypothetical protein